MYRLYDPRGVGRPIFTKIMPKQVWQAYIQHRKADRNPPYTIKELKAFGYEVRKVQDFKAGSPSPAPAPTLVYVDDALTQPAPSTGTNYIRNHGGDSFAYQSLNRSRLDTPKPERFWFWVFVILAVLGLVIWLFVLPEAAQAAGIKRPPTPQPKVLIWSPWNWGWTWMF